MYVGGDRGSLGSLIPFLSFKGVDHFGFVEYLLYEGKEVGFTDCGGGAFVDYYRRSSGGSAFDFRGWFLREWCYLLGR